MKYGITAVYLDLKQIDAPHHSHDDGEDPCVSVLFHISERQRLMTIKHCPQQTATPKLDNQCNLSVAKHLVL